MMLKYAEVRRNPSSNRFIANSTAICLLTVTVSILVTILTFSVLFGKSSQLQWEDPSHCLHHTEMWHLSFLTRINASYIENITSVNIDVLGLSIDRAIQLSSHSTVVFHADLTLKETDSEPIVSREKKGETPKGHLEVELRFQYPEQCCGKVQCELNFKKEILERFSNNPVQRLAIQSTDMIDTVLTVRLEKVKNNDGNYLLITTPSVNL